MVIKLSYRNVTIFILAIIVVLVLLFLPISKQSNTYEDLGACVTCGGTYQNSDTQYGFPIKWLTTTKSIHHNGASQTISKSQDYDKQKLILNLGIYALTISTVIALYGLIKLFTK